MEASAHSDTFARDNLPPAQQWPQLLLDQPDTAYPARLNCAVELVDAMVRQGHGERIALRWPDKSGQGSMSYAGLQALTNRIARVLVEDMKLAAGNRILLRGPNNPMMAAAWLGAIKAGLVTVPTMPLLRAKELKQIIDKAQVQAMLCDVRLKDEALDCQDAASDYFCPTLKQIVLFNDDAPDALDRLAAGKPEHFAACDTAADDVCLIAFTSGTTGAPKGACIFTATCWPCVICFPAMSSDPARRMFFAARRRWLSPSAWEVCCAFPCASVPAPCWPRNSRRSRCCS